jgi:hypothetical protein
MTLDMLLAFDVSEDLFDIIDTGRRRSASQFVRAPHATGMTAAARMVLWYDGRRLADPAHPTAPSGGALSFDNDEILQLIEGELAETLALSVREASRAMRWSGIPVSTHAAVLTIARREGADAGRLDSWLDGLRSFDDVSVAAVDASDLIVLVVTQEVPAVRDARRCVELFRRLGAREKLRLVVNRFRKEVEITPAVIAENVGLPVSATVANDYPAVIRAINRGQMLSEDSPRSPVTKDVEQLVGVLGHGAAAAQAGEKPSLLRRFFTARTSHAT